MTRCILSLLYAGGAIAVWHHSIHLILVQPCQSTLSPDLINTNVPTRVALQPSSKIESRRIFDQRDAQSL